MQRVIRRVCKYESIYAHKVTHQRFLKVLMGIFANKKELIKKNYNYHAETA